MSTDTETAVIEITPGAMETVLGILAEEDDPEALGLRIEITGTRGVDFVYDLSFDELEHVVEDDVVTQVGDLRVIVPAGTVDQLRGSTLDLPKAAGQGGLVIRNPNRPDPLAGVELDLQGTVAEKVAQLLEQSVNPSLAAHGGFATLVGVDEENKVYLTLGGGCQGCAMSRMTITEGIDRAIRQAIPEVAAIVDATDHAAGENPFY
jgi:Fe/S biogenesis protein NfuA